MAELSPREPDILRRGTSSVARDDVSLYEYFEQRLATIDARFFAHAEAQKELILIRFEAAQTAIAKAEMATERRFESVNEFRGQLKDQAGTFVPREQIDVRFSEVNYRVEQAQREFNSNLDSLQKEFTTRAVAMVDLINGQAVRIANLEGRLVAYVSAVGIGVTLFSIATSVLLHFWHS